MNTPLALICDWWSYLCSQIAYTSTREHNDFSLSCKIKNDDMHKPTHAYHKAVVAAAAAAKSLQSRPTLCDPIDSSPPGSPVPGILQARTLEWVAISFSSAWKWKVKVKSLNRVRLFTTPRTAAYQAPPPMGFSRQEYWSGLPLPSSHKAVTQTLILSLPETCHCFQVNLNLQNIISSILCSSNSHLAYAYRIQWNILK